LLHTRAPFTGIADTGPVTGYFIGESVPDDSLLAEIPLNPIHWNLTLLAKGIISSFTMLFIVSFLDDEEKLFGCGYFNDSADLPGQETLFFYLSGDAFRRVENYCFIRQLSISKVYESPALRGFLVDAIQMNLISFSRLCDKIRWVVISK
jgi:hypothetical protein